MLKFNNNSKQIPNSNWPKNLILLLCMQDIFFVVLFCFSFDKNQIMLIVFCCAGQQQHKTKTKMVILILKYGDYNDK